MFKIVFVFIANAVAAGKVSTMILPMDFKGLISAGK